jgi:hypothetical protein
LSKAAPFQGPFIPQEDATMGLQQPKLPEVMGMNNSVLNRNLVRASQYLLGEPIIIVWPRGNNNLNFDGQ